MYLFSKDNNRKYTFEGKVKLCDKPYQVNEKDIKRNQRLMKEEAYEQVKKMEDFLKTKKKMKALMFYLLNLMKMVSM